MLSRLACLRLPRLLPALTLPLRSFAQIPIERKLKRVLEKELEHEKKEYKPDDSVGPFLQDKGFQLEEQDNSVLLTLRKTVEDREVVVHFQARSPEGGEEEEEENQQQQEDAANAGSYAEFQVMVTKGSSGLLFECMASNSEIRVTNVIPADDVASVERVSSFITTHKDYRGPDFEGLDEELQKAFLEYLKSVGVDEDLATFVESYSLDKEQRLYVDWLGKVKNFIS